jgi:hypothetical protein
MRCPQCGHENAAEHKSLQMIKRYGEAAEQRRCASHQLKGVGL